VNGFICHHCRSGACDMCPGGTWCDCLHRQPKPSRTRPASSLTDASVRPSATVISPNQWGLEQALQAPAWSEETWRRVCAILRINHDSTHPSQ
jgi:hypothetical protein